MRAMERLRRMLSNFSMDDNAAVCDVKLSRFERSSSFKKRSVRRSSRAVRKRAVVTNRGIYYVETDGKADQSLSKCDVVSPVTTVDSRRSNTSYSDWIQVTDDDERTMEKQRPVGGAKKRRKKTGCRNFSLEGKSVPFDSPLPSCKTHTVAEVDLTADCSVQTSTPVIGANIESSTYGSSCTSGVHSMEKCRANGEVNKSVSSRYPMGRGVRRKPPAVLATKDNLRYSMRRLSGKRVKKTVARREANSASSKTNEEFYRMFSRLPLLFAERPSTEEQSSPTSPNSTSVNSGASSSRAPLVFNRQNPITRWLEESEKIARRSACECDRPLWSELVSYTPSPTPKGDQRPSASSSSAPAVSSSQFYISSPGGPHSSTDSKVVSSPAEPCFLRSSSSSSLSVISAAGSPELVMTARGVVKSSSSAECRSRITGVRDKLAGLRLLPSSARDRRSAVLASAADGVP